MTFTIEELNDAVEFYNEQADLIPYGEEGHHSSFYDELYDLSWSSDRAANSLRFPGIGDVKFVSKRLEYETGDPMNFIVFTVDDRTFQAETFHDSWSGETDWSFYEVEPYTVEVTKYRKK